MALTYFLCWLCWWLVYWKNQAFIPLNKSTNVYRNSVYIINGIAATGALVIVLLILSSNVSARKNKIAQIPEDTRSILTDIEKIRTGLRSAPDDLELNVAMGNNLFDLQKFNAAIPYYKRAMQLAPKNVAVCVDLGVCYFNIQMLDSAEIVMNRALEIEPGHIQALFNLGVIYYNAGKMDQASSQWRKLISEYPGSRESEIAKELLTKIKS